jgi:septum formation protein
VNCLRRPEIDETQREHEPPVDYVRRLSQEKAHAVAIQIAQPAWIIAADTTVFHNGQILGKPADDREARAMLIALRGESHTVCTGFTVRSTADDHAITRHVITTVVMREYTDDEISAYIATRDPFDKAGGYAIQHEGFHPVERIEGNYANVVGFPIDEIVRTLNEMKFTNSS